MARPQQTGSGLQQADETDPSTSEAQTDGPTSEASAPQEDQIRLEAALASLEEERAEMQDRLMRAYADMENTRKRAEKDRREAALYGGSKLARDLLPVHDNLTRALAAADDSTRAQAQGFVEGVELTLRELLNILERHGVQRVSPQPGDPFDPHMHEAMFEAPVPQFQPGQVIQVMAEGFRLHDQLLRPAQVGVCAKTD